MGDEINPTEINPTEFKEFKKLCKLSDVLQHPDHVGITKDEDDDVQISLFTFRKNDDDIETFFSSEIAQLSSTPFYTQLPNNFEIESLTPAEKKRIIKCMLCDAKENEKASVALVVNRRNSIVEYVMGSEDHKLSDLSEDELEIKLNTFFDVDGGATRRELCEGEDNSLDCYFHTDHRSMDNDNNPEVNKYWGLFKTSYKKQESEEQKAVYKKFLRGLRWVSTGKCGKGEWQTVWNMLWRVILQGSCNYFVLYREREKYRAFTHLPKLKCGVDGDYHLEAKQMEERQVVAYYPSKDLMIYVDTQAMNELLHNNESREINGVHQDWFTMDKPNFRNLQNREPSELKVRSAKCVNSVLDVLNSKRKSVWNATNNPTHSDSVGGWAETMLVGDVDLAKVTREEIERSIGSEDPLDTVGNFNRFKCTLTCGGVDNNALNGQLAHVMNEETRDGQKAARYFHGDGDKTTMFLDGDVFVSNRGNLRISLQEIVTKKLRKRLNLDEHERVVLNLSNTPGAKYDKYTCKNHNNYNGNNNAKIFLVCKPLRGNKVAITGQDKH